MVASITYSSENGQTFLDELSEMKNAFKAVIIDLLRLDLHHTSFGSSYSYCEELRKLFRQQNIPKDKPELLYGQIFSDPSSNPPPKHVIIPSRGCRRIPFKKIFKSDGLILLNESIDDLYEEFMLETCKWLMDKSYIKYHILPYSGLSVHVSGYFGTDENIFDILKIHFNEQLPLAKSSVYFKSFPELHMKVATERAEYINKSILPRICYGYNTTVKIDEENFVDIKNDPLFIEGFDTVPSKLNKLLPSKIQFIAVINNFSVIAIYKKLKGYQFLEEWNGINGVDCFISFDEKKPKFGAQAMEAMQTKNTFVVFDLIKVMAMPSDDAQIDKAWGFKITKDENNPVLIQIDYYNGEKKEATPAFLMALFLRQHLKAIKEESGGEKPKEIAFWIPKQNFGDEEYKRIQEGIANSCELLKLEFRFLDTDVFISSLTTDQYKNFEDSFFE
uniref:Uncharacterized protein n=1 Tax=Panagrolaimus sp. ES5 TaxID=591445 RepID=A0AC34G447_9BILA